jgi:integrase
MSEQRMDKFNVVDHWLNAVGYSHSNSPQTRILYRISLQKFMDFIQKTPEQVMAEYEASEDRNFKRLYAQYMMALLSEMQRKGYAPASISGTLGAVRSFFKYNDLPLGFVPSGSNLIEFHNRDIMKEEVVEILNVANVRDRAFFCVSAQSGLRPSTIANLRIGDVEGILDEKTPVPCRITVRQENTKGKFQEYFSFIGAEAVSYLKDYLKTRNKRLTVDDYVFTMFGKEHEETPVNPAVLTHMFRRIIERLKSHDVLDYKVKRKEMAIETSDHRPLRDHISRGELRLYSLRKFFRKYAGQAGRDFVNFWMGHTSSLGVDLHYFSRDVEHHRNQYAEKAMPHLRLETPTPSESEKQIEELRVQVSRDALRIGELETTLKDVEKLLQRARPVIEQLMKARKEGTTQT